MSVMGSAVAGWLISVALVQVFLVVFSFTNTLADIGQTISEDVIRVKARSAFSVRNVTVTSNDTLAFEIHNAGPSPHRASRLKYTDVIITYRNLSGASESVWVPYDPSHTQPRGWRISEVVTNGRTGEILDPFDLKDGYKGVWNPGETLLVDSWLDDEINSSAPVVVLFEPGEE